MVKTLHHFYAMLSQIMGYLEEINPDVQRGRVARHEVLANLAQYDQMLYKKRREASQATLNAFFSKASLPEASSSMSTGGFTSVT